MVTSKKVAAPGTEASAKSAVAKSAPTKPVVAKAPAKKSAATKPAAAKTKPVDKAAPTAVKKAAAPKKTAPAPKPAITAEQRNNYVEVAAFYIAERRGFAAANPADDWAAAEAEIDRLIASGHFAG